MVHQYTPLINHQSEKTISTTSKILTIGSCFSDNIGKLLRTHQWNTIVNPLGIVYNPASIAHTLDIIGKKRVITPENCGKNGEVHFHYDFHSQLSSLSQTGLLSNIHNAIDIGYEALQNCDWLIITLGTSIVYELKEKNAIVANNHRMPTKHFTKRLLSIEDSVMSLKTILQGYTDKNIILTVSPIRHTREGLVQNSRSKSRLIEVAHTLCESMINVSYFPAYEIVMDELRDYRYFKKDMIHPSEEAIYIVWQRFVTTYMTDTAIQKASDLASYMRSSNHKPLLKESQAHQSFLLNLQKTKQTLLKKYPEIENL